MLDHLDVQKIFRSPGLIDVLRTNGIDALGEDNHARSNEEGFWNDHRSLQSEPPITTSPLCSVPVYLPVTTYRSPSRQQALVADLVAPGHNTDSGGYVRPGPPGPIGIDKVYSNICSLPERTQRGVLPFTPSSLTTASDLESLQCFLEPGQKLRYHHFCIASTDRAK